MGYHGVSCLGDFEKGKIRLRFAPVWEVNTKHKSPDEFQINFRLQYLTCTRKLHIVLFLENQLQVVCLGFDGLMPA